MNTESDQRLDRFLAAVEHRALVMAELSTNSRDEALDLVQDAMMAFVRRYRHKREDDWPPLFYRILQNRMRDWGRRTRVRRRWRVWLHADPDTRDSSDPVQLLPDPAGRLPEDSVDNQAAMQHLLRAVKELPQRQREAVLLRIWEGFDVAATAAAMGCSAGSVKTHLSRGLTRLRECLEDHR